MNATMESGFRFALDIALKATFLFAITLAATALLRRSGAAARHMAATAGLLGALALPLLTLVLPRVDLPVLPSVFSSVVGKPSENPAKEFAPAAASDRTGRNRVPGQQPAKRQDPLPRADQQALCGPDPVAFRGARGLVRGSPRDRGPAGGRADPGARHSPGVVAAGRPGVDRGNAAARAAARCAAP
jgi:hypothetical protein